MIEFRKGNFVGLHRGDQTDCLQRNHPQAFLLLCLIARRARYTEDRCPITGLGFGEAFIGDWKEAGLTSRSSYRCALRRLEASKLCVFKGTKSGTNRGTTATLLPQGIFSISDNGTANSEAIKRPSNDHRTTIEQPQTTREPRNKETKKQRNTPPQSPTGDLVKVEEIYQAYPKKKGRPSALKAITKALKTTDHQTLLERTKAYAKTREGENERFTPHPATWFNDERFNDDPSTWKTSSPSSSNQPRQTMADIMAGKSSNIINASELNLEPSATHE
jgi:hypothetical protein